MSLLNQNTMILSSRYPISVSRGRQVCFTRPGGPHNNITVSGPGAGRCSFIISWLTRPEENTVSSGSLGHWVSVLWTLNFLHSSWRSMSWQRISSSVCKETCLNFQKLYYKIREERVVLSFIRKYVLCFSTDRIIIY